MEPAMTQAARVSTEVNATPDEVWEVLTDPDKLSKLFFGAQVSTDWQVGHPIRWTGEWEGKSFQDKGEVREVAPGQRLAFTHWSAMSGQEDRPENYHLVTIDLAGAAEGTQVTLTQDNASGEVKPEQRAEFEKNWRMFLDGLKAQAEA